MPRTWRDGQSDIEISTTLIRAYRELTDDSWLVELVVKEGKLSQQIGVTLIPRAQAQVLGVQRAVWHIAQMLQEHNPQLRILWMSMGASEHDTEDIHAKPGRRGASKRSLLASES